MRRITTLLIVALLAGATIAIGAPAASATEAIEGPSLNIPIGTVKYGPVGSTHTLGTVKVPEELVGMVCEVHATATNQGSVHPGNDIVVSSNGASVSLYDVERKDFVTTTADAALQLGDTLSATLILGKDKVFSGGLVVTTTCVPPEPVEVDAEVKLVCEFEDVAFYTLRAEQILGADVAPMSFSPKDGTVFDSGDSVTVVGTWVDPYHGEMSREFATDPEADCTPVPETTTTTAPPETTTTTSPPVTTTTAPPAETTTTTIPEVETDLVDEGIPSGGILWFAVALGATSIVLVLWTLYARAKREDS